MADDDEQDPTDREQQVRSKMLIFTLIHWWKHNLTHCLSWRFQLVPRPCCIVLTASAEDDTEELQSALIHYYFYQLIFCLFQIKGPVLTFPESSHSTCFHSHAARFLLHNTFITFERKTIKSEGSVFLYKRKWHIKAPIFTCTLFYSDFSPPTCFLITYVCCFTLRQWQRENNATCKHWHDSLLACRPRTEVSAYLSLMSGCEQPQGF